MNNDLKHIKIFITIKKQGDRQNFASASHLLLMYLNPKQ
jgi:hypothetical protein